LLFNELGNPPSIFPHVYRGFQWLGNVGVSVKCKVQDGNNRSVSVFSRVKTFEVAVGRGVFDLSGQVKDGGGHD